jgi:hypothetical protein
MLSWGWFLPKQRYVSECVRYNSVRLNKFCIALCCQKLIIHLNPLKFELYRGDLLQVVANDRALMHYEKSSVSAL